MLPEWGLGVGRLGGGEPRALWGPQGCLSQQGGHGGLPEGRTSELELEHTGMTQAKGREMA